VVAVEDVLDLYAEPASAAAPVVCFDEKPVQLLGERLRSDLTQPARAAYLSPLCLRPVRLPGQRPGY
jgi:hypothetical protein